MFPVQNSGILHRRGDDGGHDDVHVRDSRSHNLHRGDDGHDVHARVRGRGSRNPHRDDDDHGRDVHALLSQELPAALPVYSSARSFPEAAVL